ncbi:MAG TPA: PilN domain-containing protein [Conexibacter sp.]|nr:PilN domain-containing protein [Conexibacter sp.]
MRAVNLIPADAPGGRVDAGRTYGVYALLGVLTALVVGVTAYVLAGNAVTKHRDELATLQTQVTAVQVEAEHLHRYVAFGRLAQARVLTVRQLGATRFDWHHALAELSKVLPDNVWLTSLLGTVAPGVTVEGGASGTTDALRASVPDPAIELTGCTTSHDGVVRLVSRLRLLDGVQRVSLADSVKSDDSPGGGSGSSETSAGSDDCRHGNINFPQFDLVVFFAPLPAAPSASSSTAAATSSASTAATPEATAPASSTGGAQ